MAEFRVKIITRAVSNIQSNTDEIISVSDDLDIFKEKSVCDYNVFIVDLATVSGRQVMDADRKEFDEFLDKPSIILCISAEEYFYQPYQPDKKWVPSFSNYGWLPEKERFKVINKSGESLKPTKDSGRFGKLFDGYEWEWKCSFTNILPIHPSYVSIADNITGQSVALKSDIRQGRVIIIPTPKIDITDTRKYPIFLRSLIDLSREEIEGLTEREREEPDWVEGYIVSEELALRDKINELQKQYQILTEAHKLYYEKDKALTKTVHFVISTMTFNSEMKEGEGTHDIEIKEEDLNFVVEVTSSEEDWINIRKTRQLLDWCRRFEREQGNKPKGMLIANSYCNYPPPERDEPFTLAALKQGEAEGFCLMTTLDLYRIFCKFLKGEIDKDKIKELFSDTEGLLKLEE